jgi:hypothetical protein
MIGVSGGGNDELLPPFISLEIDPCIDLGANNIMGNNNLSGVGNEVGRLITSGQ